jgi:predicted SprT family Zn-dependent metalloprotease
MVAPTTMLENDLSDEDFAMVKQRLAALLPKYGTLWRTIQARIPSPGKPNSMLVAAAEETTMEILSCDSTSQDCRCGRSIPSFVPEEFLQTGLPRQRLSPPKQHISSNGIQETSCTTEDVDPDQEREEDSLTNTHMVAYPLDTMQTSKFRTSPKNKNDSASRNDDGSSDDDYASDSSFEDDNTDSSGSTVVRFDNVDFEGNPTFSMRCSRSSSDQSHPGEITLPVGTNFDLMQRMQSLTVTQVMDDTVSDKENDPIQDRDVLHSKKTSVSMKPQSNNNSNNVHFDQSNIVLGQHNPNEGNMSTFVLVNEIFDVVEKDRSGQKVSEKSAFQNCLSTPPESEYHIFRKPPPVIDLLSSSEDETNLSVARHDSNHLPIRSQQNDEVESSPDRSPSSSEAEWNGEDTSDNDGKDLGEFTRRNRIIVLGSDGEDESSRSFISSSEEENEESIVSSEDEIEIQKPLQRPQRKASPKAISRATFRRIRASLAQTNFEKFDRDAFHDLLLSEVTLSWSNKLRTTAGLTRMRKTTRQGSPTKYTAVIELSTKVIDNPFRLSSTLMHEMCHAAAWVVDHVAKPPHGKCFKKWAKHAMSSFPDIMVTTTHDYEIQYKYAWACTTPKCGVIIRRHSRSVDPFKQVCGRCKGALMEIEVPDERGASCQLEPTPRKKAVPSAYNIFVKEKSQRVRQYLEQQRASTGKKISQPDVMMECARLWRERK